MNCGIYKITNKINNKCYIGQSIQIEKRWIQHLSGKGNKILYKDIQKYGKENFIFEIIEICIKDKKILNNREVYWIKYYDSFNNGYNETSGGDYNEQAINSTKKIIFCYDLEGNFIKKYNSLSDAERETNINTANISRAAKTKGRTKQYQWRYEYSKNILPYKRKAFTGLQQQGKSIKAVKQYTLEGIFIKEYISISQAAQENNINKVCISKVCNGERKTAGGFFWKFS